MGTTSTIVIEGMVHPHFGAKVHVSKTMMSNGFVGDRMETGAVLSVIGKGASEGRR